SCTDVAPLLPAVEQDAPTAVRRKPFISSGMRIKALLSPVEGEVEPGCDSNTPPNLRGFTGPGITPSNSKTNSSSTILRVYSSLILLVLCLAREPLHRVARSLPCRRSGSTECH